MVLKRFNKSNEKAMGTSNLASKIDGWVLEENISHHRCKNNIYCINWTTPNPLELDRSILST